MKGNRRRKAWLALAAVVAAGLVLAGCPHNGLLEGGGGAGGIGGGSRGGGDGVQLVVTNFVDGGPVASRSVGSSPTRTIAPEHIDLTVDTEVQKYVFVASARGDGTWGPKFIDIASGTGAASLDGLGSGTWEVTLEAYDVELLKAAGVGGGDRDAVMQGAVGDVTAQKAAALVLSGGATVDTSSGTQVTLTLTKDTVEGSGTVDVAVYFTSATDVTEIFKTDSGYKVTARLVSQSTGQPVADTEVVLFQEQATQGGTQKADTDPGGGGFTYRTHTPAAVPNKYQDQTITTAPDQRKVLRYNPQQAGVPAAPLQIPAGRYMLLVTVESGAGTTLYRSDPDFYVDPQRTVRQVFEIRELLGTKPNKLEKFGVWWKRPATTDQLAGYDAILVWEENDFNAAGYTVQVADITSIYKYDGGQMKVTTDVEYDFADPQFLWEQLDAHPDTFNACVTELDWRTSPQANTSLPKWQGGFLLAGNSRVDLRLQSGHVYSVRIRASNGSASHSEWTYLDATAPTAPQQPAGLTQFYARNTKGIFALTRIAYNLLGTMDMYTLTGARNTSWRVNDGGADTKVAGEELLQVAAYTPGTPVALQYGFAGNAVAAAQGDQVLTAIGSQDIVRGWLGWQDTRTGALFGPVKEPNKVPAFTKADWTYDGYADLELRPAGAGGGSIKVQTETAGTFDVIGGDTVGLSVAAPNGTSESKVLTGLTQFAQGQTTPGIYRNAGNTRLVAVIGGTYAAPTPAFSLYVSVGGNDAVVKSLLTDKNGNPIQVAGLEAEVWRSSSNQPLRTSVGFTAAAGDVPAHVVFNDANGNTLAGLRAGSDYVLKVRVTVGQGYTMSAQFPLTILYADQAATANIP